MLWKAGDYDMMDTDQAKSGSHIYLEWDPVTQVLITRSQLHRVHRHFLHPLTSKLMSVLQRASPDDLPEETNAVLQDIGLGFSCEVVRAAKHVRSMPRKGFQKKGVSEERGFLGTETPFLAWV